MSAFTIPSIFTAVEKLSAPVRGMSRSVESFAAKTETAVARSERMFRKLTPVLSATSKQFLSFAGTAAVASGVVAGAVFSVKSLKDYETALASLSSITGVTGKEFIPFKAQVDSVAKETKKSAIEVAKAFEIVGSAKAELLDDAEALGAVTKAAITLSKASKDDLAVSAANVTGIMNQFTLGANEAERAINVLAAGSVVGAANISQINDSMTNFGAVAAGANISLEQSVALVEVMGQKSLFGAEAGTKLRGSILKLQQAGVGYKSGQFQINDALEEARKKIDKLKTAKQKDAAVLKMFGAENITTGKILLDNIETFKKFTSGVTGTNTANEQASINTNTLSNALEEGKAAWVNFITGSEKATATLGVVKKAIRFVTENLDTIVSVGLKVVAFFIAWKVAILASRAALFLYSVALGIYNAITKTATVYTAAQTVASVAQNVTTKAMAVSQWALNAAMLANPVVWVVAGIMALVAALGYVIANYRSIEDLHNESIAAEKAESLDAESKQLLFAAKAYEKYGYAKEEAQKRAVADSRSYLKDEYVRVQAQFSSAKSEDDIRAAQLSMADFEGRAKAIANANSLFGDQAYQDNKASIVNPKAAQQNALTQTMNNNSKENITIDFKNVPKGTEISGTGNSLDQVMGKLTSTQ